jgi:hypothetical protein
MPNAPDLKRAGMPSQNQASAPVFCIWMLGACGTLMKKKNLAPKSRCLDRGGNSMYQKILFDSCQALQFVVGNICLYTKVIG